MAPRSGKRRMITIQRAFVELSIFWFLIQEISAQTENRNGTQTAMSMANSGTPRLIRRRVVGNMFICF